MGMKFIAIDLGYLQGGILFWDNGPVRVQAISKIDWIEFKTAVCEFDAPIYVESMVLMPGHGKKTTQSTGRGFGRLEVVAFLCELDFTEIHPKTWQTGLGIKRDGRTYKEHKDYLLKAARVLFPKEKINLEVCDAYLIAKYISMQNDKYKLCTSCKGSGLATDGKEVYTCPKCGGSGTS